MNKANKRRLKVIINDISNSRDIFCSVFSYLNRNKNTKYSYETKTIIDGNSELEKNSIFKGVLKIISLGNNTKNKSV